MKYMQGVSPVKVQRLWGQLFQYSLGIDGTFDSMDCPASDLECWLSHLGVVGSSPGRDNLWKPLGE